MVTQAAAPEGWRCRFLDACTAIGTVGGPEIGTSKYHEEEGLCWDRACTYMGKFSMDTKRKMAQDLVPLMQKRHEDLTFEIEEAGTGEDPTVLLCAVKPGEGTVAAVDMEAFPAGSSIYMKADLCNEMIGSLLAENEDDEDVDFANITAFLERYTNCSRDYALRHVLMEAVSQKRNAELLQDCAHVKLLDLAVLFVLPARVEKGVTGAIQMTWEQIETLGLTVDDLLEAAQKNMVRRLRVRVCPLEKLGRQVKYCGTWFGRRLEDADLDEDGWYAVGSHAKILSSGFLMVPEVLKALGEKLESNYYIGVPNIHEMMICRESEERRKLRDFADWLKQSNQNGKLDLTDHLYFYDRAKGLKSVNRI